MKVQKISGLEYCIGADIDAPLVEECDCPASTVSAIEDKLSIWQTLSSSLCGVCGYIASNSAEGIGPAVGGVLEGIEVSKKAVFTRVNKIDVKGFAAKSDNDEYKLCGCKKANCRCGDECRCGELRPQQTFTGKASSEVKLS
jgi:hypothetical protein